MFSVTSAHPISLREDLGSIRRIWGLHSPYPGSVWCSCKSSYILGFNVVLAPFHCFELCWLWPPLFSFLRDSFENLCRDKCIARYGRFWSLFCSWNQPRFRSCSPVPWSLWQLMAPTRISEGKCALYMAWMNLVPYVPCWYLSLHYCLLFNSIYDASRFINGLAETLAAGVRGIAPAVGGTTYSWALSAEYLPQWLRWQFVFIMVSTICFANFIESWWIREPSIPKQPLNQVVIIAKTVEEEEASRGN